MTGVRRNSRGLYNSKDVPRFAPNFTVYLLPPDTVCLYSRPQVLSAGALLRAGIRHSGRRKELSRARASP